MLCLFHVSFSTVLVASDQHSSSRSYRVFACVFVCGLRLLFCTPSVPSLPFTSTHLSFVVHHKRVGTRTEANHQASAHARTHLGAFQCVCTCVYLRRSVALCACLAPCLSFSLFVFYSLFFPPHVVALVCACVCCLLCFASCPRHFSSLCVVLRVAAPRRHHPSGVAEGEGGGDGKARKIKKKTGGKKKGDGEGVRGSVDFRLSAAVPLSRSVFLRLFFRARSLVSLCTCITAVLLYH